MTNLDYWQTFVGDDSPETFMRNHGSMDPDLCVSRFLEDRNHLYGVVNQGQWRDTFQAPEQFQRLTVEVYLRSFLEETRDEWGPALEAKPPSIPRRYREKFDQDKYPPPPSSDEVTDAPAVEQTEATEAESPAEVADTPPAAQNSDAVSEDTSPGEQSAPEPAEIDAQQPDEANPAPPADEPQSVADAPEAPQPDTATETEQTPATDQTTEEVIEQNEPST